MTLSTWRADATSVEGADDYRSPDEAVNPTLPSSPRSRSVMAFSSSIGARQVGTRYKNKKGYHRRLLVSRRVIVTSTNTFAICHKTVSYRHSSTSEGPSLG